MMGRVRLWMFSCMTAMLGVSPVFGQVLYTQNFDVDDTANWTVFDGPTDELANFFFDYSTVGIPTAPNAAGGSTRGMKLQANLTDAIFGGFSVSPTVSPISAEFTGDYALTFDLWSNYIGKFPDPGIPGDPGGVGVSATGSTMLSTFGIMSSGTAANYAGASDSVFFASTGDGGSTSDFRAYSSERAVSYQLPGTVPEDEHATYHAGSRDNEEMLYSENFGGVEVPAAQTAAVVDGFPLGDTQFGTTVPGALGFEWHEVEIAKVGTTVTWKVDGVLLITVETADFTIPTGGTNILFGHADINASTSLDPNFPFVEFTLIDNVAITEISAVTEDADFDGDNDVDGADFLIWQKGLGTGTTLATGDANGDMAVNDADLAIWSEQYGTGGAATPAAGAVPEPATGLAAVAALAACIVTARRRG